MPPFLFVYLVLVVHHVHVVYFVWDQLLFIYVTAVIMNLTRQPLFRDAQFFFHFRRRQFSNTCTIQFNRGEIIYKQAKASNKKTWRVQVDVPVTQEEAVYPDLSALTPSDIDKLRFTVKNKVENVIRNKYGSRFTVEFFGSIRYGVCHPKSDLDMVVIDPKLPQGYKRLNGLGALYNMKMLGRTLSRAGFTHINALNFAAVPIVKFRDPESGLDCDLNVNDRLGLINSSMIKEYCDVHPHLRPLLYSIKNWAKPLGLNSPSPVVGHSVSFSSYALALMTISFLQKEGQLPNLQENLPPITVKPNKKLVWTRKPWQSWDVRFQSAKDWVLPPLPDFDTLLSSWLSYWINFPYETESVSIRDGGTIPRTFEIPPTKKNKPPKPLIIAPMSLSDPFILTKNVTSSICKRTLDSFKDECKKRLEIGY